MQTTNIIHFPGLPLFRLEYKFTQFILVPGPSSRWRWHHRHLAGPARFGRSGPVRFGPVPFGPVRFGPVPFGPVRFGPVRSRPGCWHRPGPETIGHLGVCWVHRVVKVACILDSWACLNQKSWNFLFWIYFMAAFQDKIHFLPCWAIEHCPEQWKTRKGNSVESSHNLRHLKTHFCKFTF
jgi:hypothetical protein